jgi:DNA-binding response OmpR family regulator
LSKRTHAVLISANRVWRTYLGSLLKKQGIELIEVDSREKAVELPSRYQIDVLILDLTAQRGLLAPMCRSLKKVPAFKNVPLLIFILDEQLAELDVSAAIDDFIIQKENYAEALLRIKRVLWEKIYSKTREALSIGDLMIDLENYEASISGEPVYLTFKEFELLKFLLLNRGRVFSRDELLDRVWGYDNYAGTRTVDIHVQRLRYKLGSQVGDMIVTVRNVGYKFAAD